MSVPFTNNLEKNDRVFDTVSKKQGKVRWRPRSSGQRRVAILFDGNSTRYVDVMQLRLMPDGRTPEDVPPVEGEPPPLDAERPEEPAPAASKSALDTLKAERDGNAAEMGKCEATFRRLKAANEKLDKAIAVLTATE